MRFPLVFALLASLVAAGCTQPAETAQSLSATPSAAPTSAPPSNPTPASPTPTSPTPPPASPPPPAAPPTPPENATPNRSVPHTRIVEADGNANAMATAAPPVEPPGCAAPAPCNGQQVPGDPVLLNVEEGNVTTASLRVNWTGSAPTDATFSVRVAIGNKTIAEGKGASPLVLKIPAAALARPVTLTVTPSADGQSVAVKEGLHYTLTLNYS